MTFESLSDVFFANCEKFSENYAIIHNTGECVKKCTYRELSVECCKVTQCLREVCAESFIGVFMEQDLSLPALILGILRSNLPFTCIDIEDSEERILYLWRYLSIKWVFTKNNCVQVKKVLEEYGTIIKTLMLFEDDYSLWQINVNILTENQFLQVPSTFQLAYAIQTSGSTGKPKVVFVPHQCILPNILDISLLLEIHQNDLIFLASPLTFDPSIVELFIPFTCGAALLIVPSSIRASPPILLDVLFPVDNVTYSGVTILQITPSVFSRWSESDIHTRILSRTTTLKKLLFGGEPCPSKAVLNSWKLFGNETKIFNIYGITEVSCWATVHCINSSHLNLSGQGSRHEKSISDVPLGSPLSKTLLEVRNCEGSQILHGEGELYIGGSERICLVDEEAFHQLPIPLFRATGDIVKVNESCNDIVFVGRKNRIIKRWGHRVCLNRVETVLSNYKDVETCACIWDQERNILAVAVMWKIENPQSFRLYCVSHLHKSEVPDKVVTVKSLPLTNHGKVDYEKLKYISLQNDIQTKYSDEKVTLSEQILCAWKSILGQAPPLSESFITSGGNSFLAIQLTAELQKIFGEGIRNTVMNMLINNSSVLEIMNHLLGNDPEDETQSNENINSRRTSIPNSMIDTNKSEKKPLIHIGDLNNDIIDPSTEENFRGELALSARRRKLNCDEPQTSKREKTEIPKGTICSENDRNSFSSIQNEDPLIKVSCRGMVFQREILLDSPFLKYGGKVGFHFNWKYNMHKCVDASPCYLKFAKKKWVAIGSHSHLLVVLECSSGKIISKCELPDRIESSICPSFCGKYGIVGCYDGCVYCISLLDGRIKWSFHSGAMVKSTPALCLKNTGVVVGSYDKNVMEN